METIQPRPDNTAIAAAVATGGGSIARAALSVALRYYRARGQRLRAVWLRGHVEYITGRLYKGGGG